ncbi:MAG: glycerophosphodiester phosphodiesterase [Wujia sp.]
MNHIANHPIIIAHRGASALAPHENTLQAFEIAIQLQADYVEFDIRRTKDDKLVVFHDAKLQGQPLCELSYDEICSITKRDGYIVPLFIDVLDFCKGRIRLDIEVKETGYEAEIIEILNQDFSTDEYFLKSFHDSSVKRFKELNNKVTTGLLICRSKKHVLKHFFSEYFPCRRLKKCNADFICPNHQLVTKDFVRRMHKRGYPIYIWTVNDPLKITALLQKGADGIITDRPDFGLSIRKDLFHA